MLQKRASTQDNFISDDKQWTKRDTNAYTLLASSIERKFLAPITSCIAALDAWEEHEYKNSKNIHELQHQFYDAKLEPAQSMSKLTTNLHARFDGFTIEWESTSKEDRTLPNLKLRLRKEETKILKRLQQDATLDSKAFYANRPRISSTANHKITSNSVSLYSCGFSTSTPIHDDLYYLYNEIQTIWLVHNQTKTPKLEI
uniref:Uncharacterized protein n=1 Tax=Physcomitrium patens TaxID=3218 RepID=A0A2K1JUG0_PHYPA|nr:hypothetical protein PHYPA_014932 [Physcomitrium patens]